MARLLITRGIPASGKSTYANAYISEHSDAVRVSRDDIRRMLFGAERMWSMDYEQEKLVTGVEESLVKQGLSKGLDVLVDATHLKAANAKRWFDYCDNVEFIDFPIDVETAVQRDKGRSPQVGEDGIRSFAKRYNADGKLPPAPTRTKPALLSVEPYIPDSSLIPAYIVDIDGTLAHVAEGGRSPYDYSRVEEDEYDSQVGSLVSLLRSRAQLILVSGREDYCREATGAWLLRNGFGWNHLFMRRTGDHRRDDVVKLEIFNARIRSRYNVLGVFDDRDRVVAMWRSLGLKVYQVAEGAF